MHKFNFPKSYKLITKKDIITIVKNGQKLNSYPLFIKWSILKKFENTAHIQVAFSVNKKKVKKAVKRNLIKRRMREAFRLNKHLLKNIKKNQRIGMIINYIAKDLSDYKTIENAMINAFQKINNLLK